MTELVDALVDALGRPPGIPAEPDLGRGIRATAYWSFTPSLELVVAERDEPPSDAQVIAAWRTRLNKRPIPLVLLVQSANGTVIAGPGGDPLPVVELDPRLIIDDLVAASTSDPIDVRQRLPVAWTRARDAGELTGLRNVGLFSSHYLRARAPRLEGWDELEAAGRLAAREATPVKRLERLGFDVARTSEGVYLLRAENRPAAAVLAWPQGRDLDRAAPGGELPVAGLLREMDAAGTDWGIIVSGDVWRLHRSDHPSRMTSYTEIDLAKLSNPAYFAGLFSARALRRDGLAEQIARGSREFAVALGDRLRERIYQNVVPAFAAGIASELEAAENPPNTRNQLDAVYDATLTLLYRLLFVLYAESRDFLPVSASADYRDHSLGHRVQRIAATIAAGRDFDPNARDIWTGLVETFAAVRDGHTEWGVPAYNGGLFRDAPDNAGAAILARVSPTNAALAPALYALAVDVDEQDTGRIDFSDLGIRHLGDIYEGLLQFEADRAREDLAYDADADAYVPAGAGAEVGVPAGTVYLRSRSGGRKASGSYYTPQIVVRHLVREALVPVHDEHLARVRRMIEAGEEELAAVELWSFRVCDPAMGSGHFLVDALDVLTDRIASFLSEHPLKPVRAVLGSLRETVQVQAKDLPAGVLAEIRDVDLLKRVVLKRSIYGVDQNVMAVELAKLGLWLDAFVPGLPLSYLDHNLKRGNSLVGVVGDEVLDAVRPDVATLEGDWIAERLREATRQARDAVEGVELRIADIEAARIAETQRREALVDVLALYHRWTAEPFDLPDARARISQTDTLEAANDERLAADEAAKRAFFHWPLEFPEVFDFEHGGFDVVLGNPPWDKVRFEPQHFWVTRFPGLNALPAAQRDDAVARLRDSLTVDREREEEASGEAVAMQAYFSFEYGLQGTHGHLDFAKLFLERALDLVARRGAIALVLPRQFLVLRGWAALREAVLMGGLTSVTQLSNRSHWVFPDVHASYMFALVARRPSRASGSVLLRGGIDRMSRFESLPDPLRWTIDQVSATSETLALPLLPTATDAALFRRLQSGTRLGDVGCCLGAVVSDTPYDWTDVSRRSAVRPYTGSARCWPILQTRHVGQMRLNRDRPFPKSVADVDAAALLDAKWKKSRRLVGLHPTPKTSAEASELYRIVYRYPARSDDSRTLIAALAPPGHLAAKGYAHSAVPLQNTDMARLALLGVLSTATADWWTRRYVDRHVTASILQSIPAPRWAESELIDVARITARLACEPDDHALEAVGLTSADLVREPDEAVHLRAELEWRYASSLGLGKEDLLMLLASFNEDGVPLALRSAILA